MSKRSWPTMTALACAALGLAWLLAGPWAKAPAKDEKGSAGTEYYGLSKLHEFHLEIPAKEYEKMPPSGGMRFPGRPAAPKPDKPADDKPADTHKGAGFGLEFPWVHGEVAAEGKTFKNIGVRYKGNASYMASARGLKRNFKIALDHYGEDQRFHGSKTINLNAGAMDPTRAREALSYAIFRAAGVPAPRTAFAQVTLTVPGKYDKELLGLYTVVEQVDKPFLKDRLKNGKGLLLKPERLRGLEYLGDDWDRYKDRYQPKHEPSKEEAKRVIDFARLVNKADDDQFSKEIESYLDVDKFLRFIAVNALISNLDSFLMLGHNYYIYLHPDTNKFIFIPWDLDLSLAGMPMGGSAEQQADLSLMHPYAGSNKLIDRLLAIKDVNDKYQKLLKELSETCFTREQLLKDLDAIEKVAKEPLGREKKAAETRKEGGGGFGPPGGMMGRTLDLRTFVEKRTASVAAQLAGKSKGYVPTMAFGPGGGPGGRGSLLAKPLREALDADKDGKLSKDELVAGVKRFFGDCDKDKTGKLDEKQIADGLNRILPAPPGFGPGGRPGGPGQGPALAGAIMKRADTDKDGKVTQDELIVAAEALFKEADREKKGTLEENALAAGISLLLPPGFGPGGFNMGSFWARPLREALDTDKDGKVTKDEWAAGAKKFFQDCDKDKSGKIDEKRLAEGLNRIIPGPGGFRPPPGGPGGFGPGTGLAAAIVKRADADKDGKITLDEFVAAAAALFKEVDKDMKGALDDRALAAGINLLLPPPPGFGPPAVRSEEPKKDSPEDKKP